MDAPEPAAPDAETIDTEPVVQVLGSDPWMRFDVWAQRAWEAADSAIQISREGDPMSESMDSRVIASLNAAQLAKDFASMVNPLAAVLSSSRSESVPSAGQTQAIMAMLLDDDEG